VTLVLVILATAGTCLPREADDPLGAFEERNVPSPDAEAIGRGSANTSTQPRDRALDARNGHTPRDPTLGDVASSDASAAAQHSTEAGGIVRGWAFDPPRAGIIVPEVRDATWPRGPIDRFILARLEAAGIAPSPDADRAMLARRLYFDLTGLSPGPEDIDAFVADSSPGALAALVDRLLASTAFAERFARHWLDVARYADSTGGGRTRALENAWRYRDWVIESFRRDKPFDLFAREQIAGDLYAADLAKEMIDPSAPDFEARLAQRARAQSDSLIATAFLVLGPHNYEAQDKDLLRMDVVDEQIDTTGRAFLAMTLGCARCHDHKIDPIPTRDYYALAGIFRSTKTLTPGNVSGFVERDLPVTGELARRLAEHRVAVADLETRIRVLRDEAASLAKGALSENGAAASSASLAGIVIDDLDAELSGEWKSSTFTPGFVGSRYLHDDNRAKGEKSATFRARIETSGECEVRLSYTQGSNRASAAPIRIVHADGETEVLVDQRRAPPIDGRFVSLGRFRFEKYGDASVTISNRGTSGHVIADAVQWLSGTAPASAPTPASDRQAPSSDDPAKRLEDVEAARKELERELADLRKSGPEQPTAIAVVDESEPSDWHVHLRGEIRTLGAVVPRGFLGAVRLSVGAPESESGVTTAVATLAPRIAENESGRRELAEWIVSETNPLTARVWVNRVWSWLLGVGIARSVDNFGNSGEAPTHPELLDWLALRFVEEGWSTRSLVREIVMSRTYGLSSHRSDEARRVDPGNRLWGAARRRRLDVESLRDAILQVSGDLDLRLGGPSIETDPAGRIDPKIEYGYRYASRRRSVYVPVFRNGLYEMFEVFDFADPNLSTGERAATTRSTQALWLLNGPFVVDQSRRAAAYWLGANGGVEGTGSPQRKVSEVKDEEEEDATRVTRLWRAIVGRSPNATEYSACVEFLHGEPMEGVDGSGDAAQRLERWAGLIHTLLASPDFRFLE
jgi:hypothetical protein